MSNRMLPYGYQIKNGTLEINEAEALIVKEVYGKRAIGETFSRIADNLNDRQIPFYEDAVWDKHKIKRVLENERYTGKDGYPAILSEKETLDARNYIYRAKSENTCPPQIQKLKGKIICERCGSKMTRIYSQKRKRTPVIWKCSKCGTKVTMQDDELLAILKDSHIRLKQELSELKPDSSFYISESPEARLLENKICRLLEDANRNNEEILKLIMRWTAQRYEDAKDEEQDHTERLRMILNENETEQPDSDITIQIVNCIILNERCTIKVRYINGTETIIGKEKNDGYSCQ